MTFNEFIRTARQAPILQPGEIKDYIANDDLEPVYTYLYRIAALVAADVKNTSEFKDLDDSDFIDATQECFPAMRYVVNLSPTKFSGYAAVSFRRCIRRYLRGLLNGGTGGSQSPARQPLELDNSFWGNASDWDEEDASDTYGLGMYEEPPIGLGDPLEELVRIEHVEYLLGRLDKPPRNIRDSDARLRRVEKELGGKDA